MSTLLQEPHQHKDFFPPVRAPYVSSMNQPQPAKNVHVYVNGDQYYPGKKFVINPRHVSNFDGFLTMVTKGLNASFGAVRNIYTPIHGSRVSDMQSINSGMSMVAAGTNKFQKLGYTEITPPSKRPGRPKFTNHQVQPVYHSKMNVPARWKEYVREPINISVYGNGDANNPAIKVLLKPRTLNAWDKVLDEITEKIKTGKAIMKLYTLNGEIVDSCENLENGRCYVAAGKERFKRNPYGQRAQHHAVSILSPRRPPERLPPIKGRVNPKPRDQTYSQQYVKKRQMEEMKTLPHTTQGAARQPPPRRKLRPIKQSGPPPTSEQDSVFHAKPVKVKRSGASGKLTQVAPSSEHEDDVFRAKTAGEKADEVADDESTKVEIPVDQVKATTVEDEEIHADARQEEDPVRQESSPVPVAKVEDQKKNSEIHVIEEPVKTPTSPNRSSQDHVITESGDERKPTPLDGRASKTEESPPPPQARGKLEKDKAATRIQARYRGYRAREDMKKKREEQKDHTDRREDGKSEMNDEIPQNLPLHTTVADGAAAEPYSESPPLKRSPSPFDTGDHPEVITDDQRVESVEGGRISSERVRKESEVDEDVLLENKNTTDEDETDPASHPVAETPIPIPPESKSEEQNEAEGDGQESRVEMEENASRKQSISLSKPEENEPQGDPTEVNQPVFDISSGQMISKPVLETPEPKEEDHEKEDVNQFPNRDSGDGVDQNDDVGRYDRTATLTNGDAVGNQEGKIHSPTERPVSQVSIADEQIDKTTKALQNGQAIPSEQSSTLEGAA